ncbi:MAG: CoB--CoM heterodisulfide reductase iron-sulfur subunit A family protein [Dehalococcoidia bacterium]|nr:CoB--CoM heterodisulfide reductase iron-sulfur subunit A family protein [Dehalococcoidia bacterium]MDH4366644.1 CoB--CoM heterodisulfide reductase iron-sulfur subunit A family protein [Dehalococcoidia bacterium]
MEEKDLSHPRIGVFVCHCGINIGAYVKVPDVVEYAKQLPNVVHAERNLFTCSEEGISAIKRGIKEYNLNRVLVASCTPRTHEPLFRAACEEAGLNKYLFEFVNIRDQCSWVHMREPQKATEKAKDLIRMGVAKARLLQPLEEIEMKVAPSALVIGGGIVGMEAALNLANQGFDVHLVEKEPELGGTLRSINKLFPINQEAVKLIKPLVEQIGSHPKIKTHLSSKVNQVTGFIGSFNVNLDGKGKEDPFTVGTIIVAVGAEPLKPTGQYGYGKMTNVLTQLELEGRMKKGESLGQNVVMINCVGARVPERTYCSRICCMTAIKNAFLIKESNPKAKVWILHRDLMTYGVDFETYYRKAMELGVRFVRYSLERPPEVIGGEKVEKIKVYHELWRKEIELPCDMLVLATPLVPAEDNQSISKMLKVSLDEFGFFLEAHLKLRPVEFAMDGIYICGSARWPTDVTEGVSQAYAAASKAAGPLRMGYVKAEAINAAVNEDQCSGCGVCEVLCPFQAIELQPRDEKRVSHVKEAVCKGCGTCGAACPSGAISMHHFTDEQILAQVEALFS